MRPEHMCVLAVLFVGCAQDEPEPVRQSTGPVWFIEEAGQRGLDFVHDSGHVEEPRFPEIIGSGVALLDVEGDGDLDIYLVQSGSLTSSGGAQNTNRLFLNDGRGHFEDVTAQAGDVGHRGYGMGVATGDVDRDGDVDLYVTNWGPDALLSNNGDGTFTDITEAAGLGHPGWGASAAFLDHNADGHLDLAVTNYVDWSMRDHMACPGPGGRPDYCAPNAFEAPARDVLYHANADGTFSDISLDAGWRTAFGNGLGIVVLDYDGDGLQDVFIANDQRRNQLWKNLGQGSFRDEAMLAGVALDSHGEPKAGMGVDAADIDDDGDLDLLVVNLAAQSDSFFRNEGAWFEDGTAAAGLGSISRPFTRFGMGFHDFDNDGYLDLYMANGRVLRHDVASDDPYAESNLLIRGLPGGRFEEVYPRGGTASELVRTSRGAAFGDLDGDGGIDAVVVNRDAPVSLLMNRLVDRGGWVQLDLVASDGGPAESATVRFTLGDRRIRREVRTASSYLSANPHRLHVGLGDGQVLSDLEVTWPDGTVEVFEDVPANQRVTLTQGSGH